MKFSQFSSVARSCPTLSTPRTAAHQPSLSITNSRSLLRLMSVESVMPSNHLILCHPLLLPSTFPSIRVFSKESVLHIRRPKYWSFSFSISPSNEISGLISFRIGWFDLLAVQGTLKRLLYHHSLKASILSLYPVNSFDSTVQYPSMIFCIILSKNQSLCSSLECLASLLKLIFFILYWNIGHLQYCVSINCTAK